MMENGLNKPKTTQTSYNDGPFPRASFNGTEFKRREPVGHGVNLSTVHDEVVLHTDVVLSPEVDFVPDFPYDPLLVVVEVTLEGHPDVTSGQKDLSKYGDIRLRLCR